MASMTWSVGFSSRVNCGVERPRRCRGAREGVAEVSAKKIFTLLESNLLIEKTLCLHSVGQQDLV